VTEPRLVLLVTFSFGESRMCRIAACGVSVPRMRILLASSQEGSFIAEISAVERNQRQVVFPFRHRSENGFCRHGLEPAITLACMVLPADPFE
jgi:hypothetical protein